jgi:hypothetical protein
MDIRALSSNLAGEFLRRSHISPEKKNSPIPYNTNANSGIENMRYLCDAKMQFR